jgi:hypothetical protein
VRSLRRSEFRLRGGFRLVSFGVLAIGLALRLSAYSWRPSLSIDEAQLTLNVLRRPFSDLGHQIDFGQGAPLAFLESVKAITSAFGTTEFALRLVPLAAALLSVPLFYNVASQVLERPAVIVASTLFSLSTPLILFATTVKQYSSDVLVALVLYVFGLRALKHPRWTELVAFGVMGAAAVWFSYAAAFVLAGITFVLATSLSLRRERNRAIAMGVVTAVLLVSFGASYVLAATALSHLRHSVEGSLAPKSLSPGEIGTFLRSVAGSFRYLLGIGSVPLGGVDLGDVVAVILAMLCLVGFVSLLRQRTAQAWMLGLPLILAFCAMAAGRYPVWPRLSLFAVPSIVILLANGAARLTEHEGMRIRAAAWSLLGACLAFTLVPGVKAGIRPSEREALRPVMNFLATHERQGQDVYLYHSAQYAFSYYLKCHCFGPRSATRRARTLWPVTAISGPDEWDPALRSVSSRLVIGRRFGGNAQDQIRDLVRIPRRSAVWIVLADLSKKERVLLLGCLDRAGTRTRSFAGADEERAARAYLYVLPHQSSATGSPVSELCVPGR